MAGGAEPHRIREPGAVGRRRGTQPEFVLVHDAARALTPPELIVRVVDALRAGNGAVVPALPLL